MYCILQVYINSATYHEIGGSNFARYFEFDAPFELLQPDKSVEEIPIIVELCDSQRIVRHFRCVTRAINKSGVWKVHNLEFANPLDLYGHNVKLATRVHFRVWEDDSWHLALDVKEEEVKHFVKIKEG